jgi:hypothetical protein
MGKGEVLEQWDRYREWGKTIERPWTCVGDGEPQQMSNTRVALPNGDLERLC